MIELGRGAGSDELACCAFFQGAGPPFEDIPGKTAIGFALASAVVDWAATGGFGFGTTVGVTEVDTGGTAGGARRPGGGGGGGGAAFGFSTSLR